MIVNKFKVTDAIKLARSNNRIPFIHVEVGNIKGDSDKPHPDYISSLQWLIGKQIKDAEKMFIKKFDIYYFNIVANKLQIIRLEYWSNPALNELVKSNIECNIINKNTGIQKATSTKATRVGISTEANMILKHLNEIGSTELIKDFSSLEDAFIQGYLAAKSETADTFDKYLVGFKYKASKCPATETDLLKTADAFDRYLVGFQYTALKYISTMTDAVWNITVG